MLRKTLLGGLASAALLAGGASAASAATLDTDGTTITYTAAADKANAVFVDDAGAGMIRIFNTNADPITVFTGCTQNSAGIDYTCPGSTVVIATGNLEDRVNTGPLAAGPSAKVDLGDGDDLFQDGPSTETVDGGPGNDVMTALGGGADSFSGGPGDDHFLIPTGPDQIFGNSGIDSVTYFGGTFTGPAASVDRTFSLDDQANDSTPAESANVHSDVENLLNYITGLREGAVIIPGYNGVVLGLVGEGNNTLRGSDAVNTLQGGEANDDLDGGPNNDYLVGGEGDDVLRSVDGYADRLVCGPGADTAIADTLDIVSDTCETVSRQDVGNANEDRAPTVTFDAPAAGATLSTTNVLTATAKDDRGVAQVLFLDDDQVVCTDTTAPYTCDYAPGGEDVGSNTLAVMAVDTSQQTATALRTTTVPRFAAKISAKVSPKRDAKAPYTFTTSGKVTLPASVSALGCTGTVSIQIKAGKKTISTRRAKLSKSCTYRSKVTFSVPSRLHRKKLKVTARFLGNGVALPQTAKVVRPKIA